MKVIGLEQVRGISDAVNGDAGVFTFRRELIAEAERYELSHGSHSAHSSSIVEDD